MTSLTPTAPMRTPVPHSLRRALRAAALDLKARQGRGLVPPTVWAGIPGREEDARFTASFATAELDRDEVLDAGLRTEVVLALTEQVQSHVRTPLVWVTRAGDPELWTSDLAWLRATWTACDVLGLPRRFVLVTRTGWRHEPSGTTHRWVRLRG